MLRIQRSEESGLVVLALSGHVEEQHVAELERLVKAEEGATVAFDLREVRMVDRQVVRFLADCEARGIVLRNSPSFVREWMAKRSDQQ